MGVEKLDLLLQLVHASREAIRVLDPSHIEVLTHLPDGMMSTVPFDEATVDDLHFTLRLLKGLPTTHDSRYSPQAGAMRDLVDQTLSKMLGARAPSVKIGRELAGRAEFTIALEGIDLGDLQKIGRALIDLVPKRVRRPRVKPTASKKRKPRSAKATAASGRRTTRSTSRARSR
jgi:hypothetical protein